MGSSDLEIVLVNFGVFQPYIKHAIRNLRLFGNHTITVISDSHLTEEFQDISGIKLVSSDDLDLKKFDTEHRLDETYRDGFWKNTSKRLFCLYEYMKKYGRVNCVHIENDVMVYADLSKIFKANEKLWLIMDSENRCIPCLMFVPHYGYLKNLVEGYNYQKNDMVNMAHFFNRNRDLCGSLPLVPPHTHYPKKDMFTCHFTKFGAVFDGAAIGQYLGGNDPRNALGKKQILFSKLPGFLSIDKTRFEQVDTRGFVNETCVINYSNYSFAWKKSSGNYAPYINIGEDSWIPVVNLHIHSKRLKNFCADNPLEIKQIPISDE